MVTSFRKTSLFVFNYIRLFCNY